MESGRNIPTLPLHRNAAATGSVELLRSGVKRGELIRLRSGAYLARDQLCSPPVRAGAGRTATSAASASLMIPTLW